MSRPVVSSGRGRSLRRRVGLSEEFKPLDSSKPLSDNLAEIFSNLRTLNGQSKQKKLFYLNSLDKLIPKNTTISALATLSLDDFCLCFRVPLTDENVEVRSTAVRVLRYFMNLWGKSLTKCFADLGLTVLFVRALDLVADNKPERVQILKLVRKWIAVDSENIPESIIRPIIAIAQDGADEQDSLVKVCVSTLAELMLIRLELAISLGVVPVLVKHSLESTQAHLSEGVISAVLYTINRPTNRDEVTRYLDLLVAPITDNEFRLSVEANEVNTSGISPSNEREKYLKASHHTLLAVIHSWPGLMWICTSLSAPLASLVETLRLPFADTQMTLIRLFADLFSITLPDMTDDFDAAVHSLEVKRIQESWSLFEMFVVAEANDVLSAVSRTRSNLSQNYLALVLLILVETGLLDALADVIVRANEEISIQATCLLAFILQRCNEFLPPDYGHSCHTLPSLVSAAATELEQGSCVEVVAKRRLRALSASAHLAKLDTSTKRGIKPYSLFLDQQWRFSGNANVIAGTTFEDSIDFSSIRRIIKQNSAQDENMFRMIRDSQVLSMQYTSWNWELIRCILKMFSGSKTLKHVSQQHFLERLVHFYRPSVGDFASIDAQKEHGRIIVIVGQLLVEYLIKSDDLKCSEYLDGLLNDILNGLDNMQAGSSFFGLSRIAVYLSQAYFLIIGRMSKFEKGCKVLEKSGIIERFKELVTTSMPGDIYAKLIISSFSYTEPGPGRLLLRRALSSKSDGTRIYAVEFLRVLLRCQVPYFHNWAVSLLMEQIADKSWTLRCSAFSVLDEACDIPENLEELVALQSDLNADGDMAILLRARMASCPLGFKLLKERSLKLDSEVLDWIRRECSRYVKIVEDMLNEAFSRHRRLPDGTYGRRSSNLKHRVTNVFVPPHLFGSLAQHIEGIRYLQGKTCISKFMQTIRIANTSSESTILQLKAALWTVGHIGSSQMGLQLISDALPLIAHLAESSDVSSVRATCFHALCLIGRTSEGAESLADYGWETIRHRHDEHWPLVVASMHLPSALTELTFTRGYSSSISSLASTLSLPGGSDSGHLQSLFDDHSSSFKVAIVEEGCRPRSSSDNTTSVPTTSVTDREEFDANGCRDRCHSVGASSPEPSAIADSPLSQQFCADDSIAEHVWYTKGRSGSTTSTGSSCDLVSRRPRSLGRVQSIPRTTSHGLLPPGSPEAATSPTNHFTSARDAVGYATLRAVRNASRRRVASVGTDHSTIRPSNRFHSLGMSVDGYGKKPFESDGGDDLSPLRSLPEGLPMTSEGSTYMGLCLPTNINALLTIKTISRKVTDTGAYIGEPTHRCLCLERSCVSKQQLLIPSMTLMPVRETEPHRRISRGEPPPMSVAEVRRELIRYVTRMAASIGAKHVEMSLLSLKQKYPWVFSDLCAYSEVAHQLGILPFRLSSRRFIQELFMDVQFERFCIDAEDIVVNMLKLENEKSLSGVEVAAKDLTVISAIEESSGTLQCPGSNGVS